MGAWLYQMAADTYPPADYRRDVKEWKTTRGWSGGKVRHGKGPSPIAGDLVFLFYAPSGTIAPGLYGLGVILDYDEAAGKIGIRPLPPSDHLKMHPLWSPPIRNEIDSIRGKVPRGTMWPAPGPSIRALLKAIESALAGPVTTRKP